MALLLICEGLCIYTIYTCPLSLLLRVALELHSTPTHGMHTYFSDTSTSRVEYSMPRLLTKFDALLICRTISFAFGVF